MRLAKTPMARASDAPSRKSQPNSSEFMRPVSRGIQPDKPANAPGRASMPMASASDASPATLPALPLPRKKARVSLSFLAGWTEGGHRHAHHPARPCVEHLFGAMDATNDHQNQGVIRGPLPGMSPCGSPYPQACPQGEVHSAASRSPHAESLCSKEPHPEEARSGVSKGGRHAPR